MSKPGRASQSTIKLPVPFCGLDTWRFLTGNAEAVGHHHDTEFHDGFPIEVACLWEVEIDGQTVNPANKDGTALRFCRRRSPRNADFRGTRLPRPVGRWADRGRSRPLRCAGTLHLDSHETLRGALYLGNIWYLYSRQFLA